MKAFRIPLALALVALTMAPSAAEVAPAGPTPEQGLPGYGHLPLSFVANLGQTDSRAAFVAHGRGYTLFVGPAETVFVAQPQAQAGQAALPRSPALRRPAPVGDQAWDDARGAVVHLRLLGADPSAVMTGEEQISSVNYLIGSDRSKWRTGVPAYARVRSHGIYPGVDLVFYGSGRQFEYDFVVAPGIDPRSIRLGFDGIAGRAGSPALHIDTHGDLVLRTATGELRLRKPLAYQEVHGGRHPVAARYVVRTVSDPAAEGRPEVGIDVAAYDTSRPLVIDPVLDYSTYLGGGGSDAGMAIAVDATGHAYVTGYTESPDFPMATGPAPTGGGRKVFVAKLNPAGSGLLWATYLGGDGSDTATSIAVDRDGRVYVTGLTDSTNFPTTSNAHRQTNQGGIDAFVTKLAASGSTIDYSTYLGGGGTDAGLGIAVGRAANPRIYVTGYTESVDFPVTTSLGPGGGADAFVVKVNPSASALTSLNYSTRLGGAGRDEAHAIALDALGQPHITGFTESDTYPTQGAFQQDQPGTDAFVSKLDAAGSGLLYSTYLGGAGTDAGLGIALDSAGKIVVTGHTDSPDFPTRTPHQGTLQGGSDAFVTKLDPVVSGLLSLLFSTYLGGGAQDHGLSIAVNSTDHVYVAGYTDSTDFPTRNGPQTNQGGRDAFAVRLQPGAAAPLVYSTYLGGSASDEAYGIALDPAGNAYITGLTQSADFPAGDAFATTLGGSQDAFIAKLTSGADLIVSSLSAVPSGARVRVTETTRNQGELPAAATTTAFYLSSDTALDIGVDVLLGSRGVPPLDVGEANTATTTLTVPATAPGGSYFVIAKANADGAIPEPDTSNNTAVTTGTIGLGADLVVQALDVPGVVGGLQPGATFTVTDDTRNMNSAVPAGPSTTRFYLVTGTTLAGGEVPCASAPAPPCFLGSRAVPPLPTPPPSSTTSRGPTQLTLPHMAGTFRIVAKADADNAVAEANEDNNVSVASAAFAIGPDLGATLDVPAASSTPAAGAPISITDFTKNNGAIQAPASTTGLYLSTSSTLGTDPVFLARRDVPTLAPGQTHSDSTAFTLPAGHTGIRWIFAMADDLNAIGETNEGNNVSTGKSITIGADLIVLSLDVPGSVQGSPAGATVTVTDFTRNNNSAPAGPSTTRFYLVTGTTLAGGEVPSCALEPTPPCFLGSRPVPALLASTTHGPVETTLTLPGTAAGTLRIIAKADADDIVAEANETNNLSAASRPFTLGGDLLVSLDLPGQYAAVAAGATISIADFTKNDGGTLVGPSTTRFFLSSDANPAAGFVPLGFRAIPTLAAGVEDAGSTQFTLPTQFAGAPIAGIYRVTAVADADGVVAESNEANNTAASSAIAVGPDLTLSGTTALLTARVGATIFVSDFTKNRGAGNAPASTTGIYLSNDAVHDAGDSLLGSRAIPGLVAGASSQETTAVVIPGTTPPGCYFIITAADAGRTVGESDEANNVVARPVEVVPGPGITMPCARPRRLPDFDGDGKADVLWRDSSGRVHMWLMDGGSISGTGSPASVGTEWTVQGAGDFNGDGKTDVLWRHSSSLILTWFMDGGGISGTAAPGSVGADWAIQGVGDFNGDGKADILWRDSSGLVRMWLMDGGSISGTGAPASVGAEWTIQGVGDFNGDGKADVLWRHSSGLIFIWFMDGGSISGTGTPATVGSDWTIQGVGDFNGDGKDDVLWRHSSGFIHIWFMDGGSITGTGTPATVGSDWTIHGIGDVNGNDKADILWRHSSGFVHFWFMDGGSITGTGTPATVGSDWTIQ